MISDIWKIRLSVAMKNYFKSYKKRFTSKSDEDALNATRNWVVGYVNKMFGPIDEERNLWIEQTLNNLLSRDL